MDMDGDKMAERILHLTLEILFRLTGEDYTVVKKTSSERCQAPVYEGWGRPLSPITGPPPHPPIHEDINDQKILELTYKMIELLTGEVTLLGMLGHYTAGVGNLFTAGGHLEISTNHRGPHKIINVKITPLHLVKQLINSPLLWWPEMLLFGAAVNFR
ncbi:oocyte zinc finger protein XlCOF29-like [Anomaloglossus baeobatrachus]|uniref:oocyte zinc finger protein XlCOF29-like n=1 Tax=Anomaloglossus baeobatrachus TaxID=238106 RepID=UPI003F508A6A